MSRQTIHIIMQMATDSEKGALIGAESCAELKPWHAQFATVTPTTEHGEVRIDNNLKLNEHFLNS